MISSIVALWTALLRSISYFLLNDSWLHRTRRMQAYLAIVELALSASVLVLDAATQVVGYLLACIKNYQLFGLDALVLATAL